jgi:hypothetical protein
VITYHEEYANIATGNAAKKTYNVWFSRFKVAIAVSRKVARSLARSQVFSGDSKHVFKGRSPPKGVTALSRNVSRSSDMSTGPWSTSAGHGSRLEVVVRWECDHVGQLQCKY